MTFLGDIGRARLDAWLGDEPPSRDRVRSPGTDLPLRVPREGHPIGANVGFVPIDVLSDCLDRTLAPFVDAPPREQGTIGAIAQYAGGVMGLFGAPAELVDTAMSQVPIPSLMELVPFPAATMNALHVGTPHAHLHPPSTVPPAPPIPLPSLGTPLASGCVSVLINGVPALRCGDLGLGLTCVSLAPAFEVLTGSRTVFIGGSRAARLGDLTVHCNPIALVSVVSALSDIANVGIGAANAVAHGVAALDQAEAAEDPGEGAAAAAEAQAAGANAVGEAMAAAMAAVQAASDAQSAILKGLLGTDVGIAPGVGMVVELPGVKPVLIGGASMPSASMVLGELRAAFARRSCRSRSRMLRWVGRRLGAPDCA